MNYTKGKWKADAYGNVFSGQNALFTVHSTSVSEDELKSNLSLLLSSPDMYEALKLLTRCYSQTRNRHRAVWLKVQVALAKAEGQQ